MDIVSLLITSTAATSKRQAREDVTNGAVHVNGTKVTDVERTFSRDDMIGGEFLVIRRGKKKYFLVKCQ